MFVCFQNNSILQSYLLQKESEQNTIETTLKTDHFMKVLQIYTQENEKSRRIIELSHEILQEAYFVLNGNMLLTEATRDKFSQLYKIHDQRGVKFTESDEIFEISEHTNPTDFLFDEHLMTKDEPAEDFAVSNKRIRENGDDDSVPTKKRVVRSIFDGNLDSTQVLERHDDLNSDDGMNATFAIKPTTNKTTIKGIAPIRVLKESNPNVHKGFVAPKAITKPITKVKSTLITGREKENKRTPLKIRRSPRSVIADPLNRSKF